MTVFSPDFPAIYGRHPLYFLAELLGQAQRYLGTQDFAHALPLLQKAADVGDTTAKEALERWPRE